MRHRVDKHSFGRKSGPRKALLRGLVDSLVEHGRVKTTVAKAKELRRHVEKAVTIGKKGDLASRRLLLSRYPNKDTVSGIVDDISKRFQERPGGYTRIIKIGARPGDTAEMAFIEFVDYVYTKAEETKVEGDSTFKTKVRAQIREKAAKKKRIRKTQAASRRANRPTK
jgi:large subunit ribosomal protein L17